MDTLFIYDKPVSGKDFIGRKSDATVLGNLIAGGENVALYEPPKSGKHSLVNQAFISLKTSGRNVDSVCLDLLSIRTLEDFLCLYGDTVLRCFSSVPGELKSLVERYLGNAHFVFDQKDFEEKGRCVSLNWSPDENDVRTMLSLPFLLCGDHGKRLMVMLDEFQNILFLEDGEGMLKIMESVIKEHEGSTCSFLFCGSKVNAMKYIFEHRHFLYRRCEHLSLSQIDERDIAEMIIRGWTQMGKVVEKDLVLGICKMLRNDPWRICHICSICDSLSRGYIVEATFEDALRILLSIHEPQFQAMVNDLTTFQISLLKACLDGYKKFSASEVISKYGLNSSANVKRLKDALTKKEILTFGPNDEPLVLDPLFEYWLRNSFFAK